MKNIILAHHGDIELSNDFNKAWEYLSQIGEVGLVTSRDIKFKANSGTTKDGRKVIKFLSNNGKELARAYQCCWGYYHNCYGNQNRHVR